jgi:Predicted glycosyltransferases
MMLVRFFIGMLLLILSPLVLFVSAAILCVTDICFAVFGRKRLSSAVAADNRSASVVIPNWNGRDLLEKYLPSVVAGVSGNSRNEVIVIDNASTDGSADFVAEQFPQVRLIRCDRNLGFGGGSNLGFREAKNDIVVLLNNDMRVERDFLAPLLEPFADALVFSISCQIFFSDPDKRREETGLTQGWWRQGRFRVTHRVDDEIVKPFPCFYGGGGSSAYDRHKFLELGGFDEILRPFYYEDTDLGFMAWKRGWKVLYQPQSIVYHEHRGTIGRKFSPQHIQRVLKKNAVLMVWKNIHSWRMLLAHFTACFTSSLQTLLFGDQPGSFSFPGLAKAFFQIGGVAAARWRARSLAAVDDREAFRRHAGGYFRDRFEAPLEPVPAQLRVLFAAPYAIEPPLHGGAVFMKATLESLAPLARLHVIGMVDRPAELERQKDLSRFCQSVMFQVRRPLRTKQPSSRLPHAVREFADPDFEWRLHRILYQGHIDVVQLEYAQFAQYAGEYKYIPCFLFEHDLYFQSVARTMSVLHGAGKRVQYCLEYLRALRYELRTLPKMTRVQVCGEHNAAYLRQFLPELRQRLDSDLRAGIQTQNYRFSRDGRESNTLLFVGSFRHEPNVEALRWLVSEVLPRITAMKPEAQLVIVGSEPPPSLGFLVSHPSIRFTGYVEDIRGPFASYAVFVCPIRSGSGVRVKLLEAFASGIPAVSTSIGAEGLADASDDICEIADSPDEFAKATVRLLEDKQHADDLAARARHLVETEKNGAVITKRLESVYRKEVTLRRPLAAHHDEPEPEHASARAATGSPSTAW